MHHRAGKFICKGKFVGREQGAANVGGSQCGDFLFVSPSKPLIRGLTSRCRRQPGWCQTKLTTVSACSDRPVIRIRRARGAGGVDPDVGNIAKSATICLILKTICPASLVWPSELVTRLPIYRVRVAIQTEFVSSVSKARDPCRSITLRPPTSLPEQETANNLKSCALLRVTVAGQTACGPAPAILRS